YLPAGGWVDFWSDALHRGPCTVTVATPLDTLALFIRQGAILPLGPEMQHVGEHPLDPVTLEIYPSAEQTDYRATLYEDDGETKGYRPGGWERTAFQLTVQTDGGTLEIGKARGQFSPHVRDRCYLIHFHHQAAVHTVLSNGAPLACL